MNMLENTTSAGVPSAAPAWKLSQNKSSVRMGALVAASHSTARHILMFLHLEDMALVTDDDISVAARHHNDAEERIRDLLDYCSLPEAIKGAEYYLNFMAEICSEYSGALPAALDIVTGMRADQRRAADLKARTKARRTARADYSVPAEVVA